MREFDAVITALLLTTIRRLSNERLGERKKERGRDREGGREADSDSGELGCFDRFQMDCVEVDRCCRRGRYA